MVIVLVGLPARGKSYLTKMLTRYLQWIGFTSRVFNLGDYRRKMGLAGMDKDFFENNNTEGKKIREQLATEAQVCVR